MSNIKERFELLLENPTPANNFEFKDFLRNQPIHSVLENSELVMIHEASLGYLTEIYESKGLTTEQCEDELNKVKKTLAELSKTNHTRLATVFNKLRRCESILEHTIAVKSSDEYLLESTLQAFEKESDAYKKKITDYVVTESYQANGPDKLFLATLEKSLEADFATEFVKLVKANDTKAISESVKTLLDISSKYNSVYEDSVLLEANGTLKDKAKKVAIKADEKSRDLTNKARKGIDDTRRVTTITGKAVGRLANLIDSTYVKLRDMDKDQQRKALLTGGIYKRAFKFFRLAVVGGSVSLFSPALSLIVMVCMIARRHMNDTKLINDLKHDLETERRIINEKIRDADSNGDKKQKYQLMRLEDKISKEIARLESGTKSVSKLDYRELKRGD